MESLVKIKDEKLLVQDEGEEVKDQMSNMSEEVFSRSNRAQNQEESYYWRLINGDFLQRSNFSSSFLNFLSQCLTIDPESRGSASQLLSHPIFKEINSQYVKSQITMTLPQTSLEKQFLSQFKDKNHISIKQILEISKLKAIQEYSSFLDFLKSAMGNQFQIATLTKPRPMFCRAQRSHQDYFSEITLLGEQDRSKMRNHSNFVIVKESTKTKQKFTSIVLKPDIGEEIDDIKDSNSLYEEAKTIKSNGGEKDMVSTGMPSQGFISESMSVQSSFMDKISMIFSYGRPQQQPPQQQVSLPSRHESTSSVQKSQKSQKSDAGVETRSPETQKSETKRHNNIRRYIIFSRFLDSSQCSQSKISQILKNNSDLVKHCHFLRRKLWTKLLPDSNQFSQFITDMSPYYELRVHQKEITQVWNDIKRCEHFHPYIQNDQVKKRLHTLILQFLNQNQDACYIQGLDSVGVVLLTEFIDKDEYLIPMMKQIYNKYLKPFVLKEQNSLSFNYPCLLVSRLLQFYVPELFIHFKEIGFTHNLYLVCWVMTLFAHSIPINQVVLLWTDLFCEKVDYLFFITIAILMQLESKLLLLDLNNTLSMINNISGLIDIDLILEESKKLMSNTPQSFIASDFTFDYQKNSSQNLDMLKQNEYFRQRWWELEYLDYREDIEVCLISAEDAINLKNKIFIDVRGLDSFGQAHFRQSNHMVSNAKDSNKELFNLYLDFFTEYNEFFPQTFIVIIGDQGNLGHQFVMDLIEKNQIKNLCLLKGGIDALKLDYIDRLRKTQQNQQIKDFRSIYEKFVKRAKMQKQGKKQIDSQQS